METQIEEKKRGRPKRIKEFEHPGPSVSVGGSEVNIAFEKLLAKVESLEKKDEENQKQLKMLYAVADKGRVFNYETSKTEKKPAKVKLSTYDGKVIVGWRVVKDQLVKNPTTGLTIGETQEIEILLLDKEGVTTKASIDSYVKFSDIRYAERIECEIIGKKEDYSGKLTFDVQLPDGRIVSLDGAFLN